MAVLALIGVAALGAAQRSNIAVCDGIAAQIRKDPEIVAGSDRPLLLLSRGNHPYILLPGKADMRVVANRVQFSELFRQEFRPSKPLANALDGCCDNAEVYSLPGSDLHMIETFNGTANCSEFLFFQTTKDGASQPLPALPPKGERDGDNLICEGFGDEGNLARIAGIDAFLEVMANPSESDYDIRAVPFQQGKWGPACKVSASFRTEYTVSKVFVPADGPVSEIELRNIAAEIVRLHAAAKGPESFSFGPPVPEGEKQNALTMSELAGRAQKEAVSVPAFGRENELGAFETSLAEVDHYPLVLGGRTYLMTIGRGAIGWRDSSELGLILYALQYGKLEPVGTAIVQESRGALKFVRSAEWKVAGPTH